MTGPGAQRLPLPFADGAYGACALTLTNSFGQALALRLTPGQLRPVDGYTGASVAVWGLPIGTTYSGDPQTSSNLSEDDSRRCQSSSSLPDLCANVTLSAVWAADPLARDVVYMGLDPRAMPAGVRRPAGGAPGAPRPDARDLAQRRRHDHPGPGRRHRAGELAGGAGRPRHPPAVPAVRPGRGRLEPRPGLRSRQHRLPRHAAGARQPLRDRREHDGLAPQADAPAVRLLPVRHPLRGAPPPPSPTPGTTPSATPPASGPATATATPPPATTASPATAPSTPSTPSTPPSGARTPTAAGAPAGTPAPGPPPPPAAGDGAAPAGGRP